MCINVNLNFFITFIHLLFVNYVSQNYLCVYSHFTVYHKDIQPSASMNPSSAKIFNQVDLLFYCLHSLDQN